jgi:thioredoxin 1
VTKEVKADTYKEEVLESINPVLVDFWGPSCVPCLALSPLVDSLADKYVGKLKVVKVDASKNRRLCLDLKVLGLPTFVLYKDGKEVGRFSGGSVRIAEVEDAIRKITSFE